MDVGVVSQTYLSITHLPNSFHNHWQFMTTRRNHWKIRSFFLGSWILNDFFRQCWSFKMCCAITLLVWERPVINWYRTDLCYVILWYYIKVFHLVRVGASSWPAMFLLQSIINWLGPAQPTKSLVQHRTQEKVSKVGNWHWKYSFSLMAAPWPRPTRIESLWHLHEHF